MARINNKEQIIDYESSIKKSNELSMAKLNHGLSLNQMQLLAYAIYSTQQDGKPEFHKSDFEKKFGLSKYNTADAYKDSERILGLRVSMQDLENDKFQFWNVFASMEYNKGVFTFKWNEEMVPHILELREKYVVTDLTITANFKSSFSWTLYDYLKAHYGYWHKLISKESLMKLFGVENRKTYKKNTGRFKSTVLDVAIKEINTYTELEVRYEEERKGRSIVGFDLIWSTGKSVRSATEKQIEELKRIVFTISEDMFKFINLNDAGNRKKAIELVRMTEGMKKHITDPGSITFEKADELLFLATNNLRLLNMLLKKEKMGRDSSLYYNWLEDKG